MEREEKIEFYDVETMKVIDKEMELKVLREGGLDAGTEITPLGDNIELCPPTGSNRGVRTTTYDTVNCEITIHQLDVDSSSKFDKSSQLPELRKCDKGHQLEQKELKLKFPKNITERKDKLHVEELCCSIVKNDEK